MSFGSYILNAVRDDRAYGEMLKAAQARLQGRNAADVAQRSGFAWNTETNTLSCASLGRVVTVEAADWSIHGALGNWHALTVLHYLDMVDAKMFDMQEVLEKTEPGKFSERVWTLDNRTLYRIEE